LRTLVARRGSILMGPAQMAGHSVFDVRVTGANCRAVASRSFFGFGETLPFTSNAAGDIGPFSSSSPITVEAHGTCATEIYSNRDGRLLQRKTGTSYTMTVPAGSYWLFNTYNRCTVSVS
jgi:hypothetical protein